MSPMKVGEAKLTTIENISLKVIQIERILEWYEEFIQSSHSMVSDDLDLVEHLRRYVKEAEQ